MTDTPAETLQPVAELFTASVSVLWATTYDVDLALFNEFLLARLGDPPLNVVVLADHRRLAASLDRIPIERVDTLANVNRRWLLRGVRPGGQAFHAKSYLAIGSSRATLLVGSGNLSLSGLDEGREVFTAFRSGTPIGDVAIATWRSWMLRLVETLADVILAERFKDLERQLPSPPPVALAISSPLLHNLDVPIGDQLIATVAADAGGRVDELLLTAPFFDANGDAVGQLVGDLQPRQVRVFVTRSTSVNGDRLAERLAASGAQVKVFVYEPAQFVHAKLVGIIAGGRAWLLSGSPNLSQAALARVANDGGNVELAVITPLDPDQVRSLFVPPGMTISALGLDDLVALRFGPAEEPSPPAVRLISATATTEGRVEVRSDPTAVAGWFLDDLTDRQPLAVDSSRRVVTAGPLGGRLVQLVDADGSVLSNKAVVDDLVGLADALATGAERTTASRPPEIASSDVGSPLAQALVWLHRNLVMDVSERLTATPTGGVAAREAGEQADDDLWERLEREQLARDHRAGMYDRIWTRNTLGATEPIIELLDTLRARAPVEPVRARAGGSVLAHLLGQEPPTDKEPQGPTHRWTVFARIRVRARNVLRRWADAQTDPRLVWVDPLAPAGNFTMITLTLAVLRLDRARDPDRVELTDDDLDDIWFRWLSRFVGTGEGDGWLGRLDAATLDVARQRLPEWLSESSAALCWLAVRPGSGKRERIVAWQPVVAAALKHDLLDPTDNTASYVTAIVGRTLTRAEVERDLLYTVEFIDDALWCARVARELGLDEVELQAPPGAAGIEVRLDVRGVADPLLDPRVPRLAVAACRYRRCEGVAVWAVDADWRLALRAGAAIAYREKGTHTIVHSTVLISDGLLEQLAGTGGVLASLFPADQVA